MKRLETYIEKLRGLGLVITGLNKTKAAQLLDVSLKTLHNKLNSYRARGLLFDKSRE